MASDSTARRVASAVVVLGVTVAAAVAAWVLFVDVPAGDGAVLAGVVLAVLVALGGLRVGSSVAGSLVPTYNVAEVGVEGPITRTTRSVVPTGPVGASADEVVDQIAAADDSAADALLVRLNTPGGEVVPSDDIRRAVDDFDGPTVAYATDVCASGGYWIAAGCDHVVAREGSVVGSIGVIGSLVTATDLADRVGLSYERFAAGQYKDAGSPLKDLDDDDRAYLQGLIDEYYEAFVDRVTEGRDLDAEAVRDTEARVFLGREAAERGLVDDVGTREDATDRLAERLGERVSVRAFRPSRSLAARMGRTAATVAAGVRAGLAGTAGTDRLRVR
jgi:protease-4